MTTSWHRRRHPAAPGRGAILWAFGLLLLLAMAPVGAWLPAPSGTSAVSAMALPALVSAAPRVSSIPDAGPPQTILTVTGSGFTAGDHVTISYADMQNQAQRIGTATVTATGTLEVPDLTIPPGAAPGGVGLISIREATGGAASLASTPFAVTPLSPSLQASPNVAAAGGTVTISGAGFEPDAAVQLQLRDANGVVPLQAASPITTTAAGAIGPLTVTVPPTLAVAHSSWLVLNAEDAAGAIAGIPITLLPVNTPNSAVRLQPARAVLGAQIRIAAEGFLPGEPIDVTLIAANGIGAAEQAFQATAVAPIAGVGTPFGAALTADSIGYVEGIFALPVAGDIVLNDAPGTVAGNAGTMLTVSLRGTVSGTLRSAPLILSAPHIHTVPAITIPGHPYTILGSGFAAGEQVNVLIANSSGALTPVGRFRAANCGDPGSVSAGSTITPPAGTASGSACESGTFSAVATAPTPATSLPSTPIAGQSSNGTATPVTQSYRLSVTGLTSGLTASSTLILASAPALTLQRYVAAPGESIVVQGNAFVPNATVTIQAAFPNAGSSPSGLASCTGANGTATSSPATTPCAPGMLAATDSNGSFRAQITVPLAAQLGPVAIQAQDSLGDQASTVLTVNNQPPAIHVPTLAAQPGQVLTIHGNGFGSGETVDVFLAELGGAGVKGFAPTSPGEQGAQCGALLPTPLPNSTLTTTADAVGSFVVSYPLPQPFDGTYYVAALGETSRLCAFNPLSITSQLPTPLPTPTPCAHGQCVPAPTPTPTPPINLCAAAEFDVQTGACAADSVTYFADGSTAQIATQVLNGNGYPGLPCTASVAPAGGGSRNTAGRSPSCSAALIAFDEELHLLNEGDKPASVSVAYFIYGITATQALPARGVGASQPVDGWITPSGGGNLQLPRRRTFLLPPHSAMVRSVNADIGDGHLVSIIVRAGGRVTATTVTHRVLLIEGCAGGNRTGTRSCQTRCSVAHPCAYNLDAASSAGSGTEGPQTGWLFAQGYLGGAFDEYVSLLNPQTGPTIVQIRALTTHGPLPTTLRIGVPASGRQSVDLRSALAALCTPSGRNRRVVAGCPVHDGPIALQVSSTEPIVAERALYWGEGSGPARAGYDAGAGAPAIVTRGGQPLARVQYIAYASTLHGDQAYLALVDPTIRPAAVTISAYSAAGMHLADKTIRVPAQGCATISLAEMVYPGVYALAIRSDMVVTGELAQYSGGSPQAGAHGGMIEPVSTAATGGTSTLLGTGDFLSVAGTQRNSGAILVRVFNTGSRRIVAQVNINTQTGEHALAQYQIAAKATLQSAVPLALSGASGQPVGVSIRCGGPCLGIALATGGQAGVPAIWGNALR